MPTKKTKIKEPKTKLKKPKAAKVKKEKPAKAGKKTLLPKNKRVVVLLVAALFIVIIGAAQAIILLSMRNKNTVKEKVAKSPEYYFSKDEDISSFTAIVGDRTYEEPQSVPESSEATEKTDSAKKESDNNSKSAAESKTASEGDTAADKQKDTYKYVHLDNASADLKSYKDYLETQKSFIDVTEESTTAETTESETKSENSECYQLAGPSSDSKSYLSITLESEGDSVTVTADKGSESWNDYFKNQWNQQKKVISDIQKQPKSETSIEQAENTVRSQGQEKLKLSESADSYQFIASPGISKIDGKNYYTVRTYKRLPDSTLNYVATYLCDCTDNSVSFQYDEITGQTTPLG